MFYGFHDDYGPNRRPLIALVVAVALVWAVLQLRNPGAPFLSPWRDPAAQAAANAAPGSLTGSFGALSGETVIGAPTISAAKIDAVLATYGSPATGTGQAMYDLGLKYGIDPAFCLAFFIHESTAGTRGVATVTKSVGNIRVTPGYDSYQGYRRYATWEAGIEDWYKLIRDLYIDGWKLTTVEQILPVYAPPADNNDTEAYIATVNHLISTWRAEEQ
ncbi:MAG TPA: glucosaminidase domain-containing protein [Herpetosiphonaceae bacterium]